MRPIAAMLFAGLCAACASADQTEVLDGGTGAPVAGLDALTTALAEADVVVIGEIHDNPVHQANQARLVAALNPGAVALEMVQDDEEAAVNAALAAGSELSGLPGWERFKAYEDVLRVAGPGRVIGAGQPRERVRQAVREGAAAAFTGVAADYDLDAPLPPELQAEMEEEQFVAHCEALPREMLPMMVEGQRLRDAAFADAALRALKQGKPAVLIAGNGHVRTDRGVPAYLQLAEPGLRVVAVAQVERPRAEDGPPYDYVVVTEPGPDVDHCAQFLKSREGG